ncbi:MAG: translocation/assembly module TamB domain-containing protein, partial [Microcoleaceae cyanobacterium MO_207.B10]|nr:translocation/assembly module TamB domain-containing protein [Microcoleaceae cyanobacterium MO_207.B10]
AGVRSQESGVRREEKVAEKQQVAQEKETNFNPLIELDLKVENLALEAIAGQYGFASPVAIGDFSTEVEIAGPLESLKGEIQWQLPKAIYPISGTIDIANSQADIKNTALKIGGGTVNIDGNANLENWQISATANQITLDNLEPLQPLGIPPELEGIFKGQFNVAGLTNNFSTNTINGGGSGVLNIASGQVNLNGKINNGDFQGKATASQLRLSSLERIARKSEFLNTTQPILSSKTDGTINGEATVTGNLNNLSLAGINANIDGNVNLANGRINANADVSNGNFQASVNTAELPVNHLLDLGVAAANSGIITDPQPLNNIQTNIPRLKNLNAQLNGRVNLSGNLANIAPENLAGNLIGNLQLNAGKINATGRLNSGNFQTTFETNQISLTALEQLLTTTELVAQKTDIFSAETNGQIQGKVTASGNINNLNPAGININSDGKLTIAGGTINATGKINNGNFQASVNSSKLAVNPLLDLGTAVLTSGLVPVAPNQIQNLQTQINTIKILETQVSTNANISGNLTNLSSEAITASTKSKLFIDGNGIDIDAELNQANFLVTVETGRIPLSTLESTIEKTGVISLPETATLPPNIEGAIIGNASLFGNLNNLNPNAITAKGDGQLILGNNTANAQASLNNGNFEATVIAEPIPVSFVEELALETGIVPAAAQPYLGVVEGNILGEARAAGNLDNLNPEAIAAEAEGKLILADGGVVNVTGELVGQQWQASVVGDQIPLEQFSRALEKQQPHIPAFVAIKQAQQLLGQAENLPVIGGIFNGNIDLSGSLANLSSEAITAQAKATLSELPIIQKPFNSLFNWDGKQVGIKQAEIPPVANASGVVGLDFPPQNSPTFSGVNINVNLSDFNLASLPVKQFVQNLPIEQKGDLLAGRVTFDGKVMGESIDDLSLVGDVVLRNLAINKIDFDQVLAGKLQAELNDGVSFQVAGNQDRLELVLDEGYFPTAFLVQRDDAKLAGVTQGEDLVVTLNEFPLELIGLAPAPQFGLGAITGKASAEVAVSGLRTFDLNSIKAGGKLAVDKPGIGHIDADSFTAQISYDDGKAALNDGALLLGESRYLLEGLVDISKQTTGFNPKFVASLDIEKGEFQDILTALQWYKLSDIGRGFATPDYASAADVQPVDVGFPDNTALILQLRRFAEIQALLQQQQESENPQTPIPIPPLADVNVAFSGKIVAQGSFESGVEAEFNIEGDDWSWGPYLTDKFLLEGNYQNEVLTVEPLRIQIGEAVVAFAGKISPQSKSGELEVENIELAKVQQFAKEIAPNYIPPNIDITGKLNAKARLGGSLDDPRAVGDIKIVDGSLNGEPINQANTDFSYNIGRLNFGGNISITGDPILFTGSVPIDLPFAKVSSGSDIIDLSVNIKNEALEIVNLLSDQVTLDIGQGDILLRVRGTLQQPQPEGFAKFADTTITAAAFPNPLTDLEGTVLFEGDRIEVKQIQGSLSDGIVAVTGVLPIFQPLNQNDPDIENPLAITLEKLNLDFQEAFVAGINGNIIIKGTAFRPEIGGNVAVSQGRVFLNKLAGLAPVGLESETTTTVPGIGEFDIDFNNFGIILADSLRMVSPGLVNFQVAGGFKLNGTLSDPQPNGTINVESGVINLFSTDMRLDRSYENTATFIPSNGLEPILDVQLVASAFESSGTAAPANPLSAETTDAPLPGTLGSSRRVKIMATIKGAISQLEQNIELSSSPPRSDAQIVSLLGGSVINTLQDEQGLALANVAATTLFTSLEQDIIDATGLSEFRVFPANIPKRGSKRASSLGWGLEVGVDVTENLGVSITRLFGANEPPELSLRYQLTDKVRLRGGSNFDDNSVLSIEYESRF